MTRMTRIFIDKDKEETFETRFNQLLSRVRTDELSLDEITREVEDVRQKRYIKTMWVMTEKSIGHK
jgi:hypothetical protein